MHEAEFTETERFVLELFRERSATQLRARQILETCETFDSADLAAACERLALREILAMVTDAGDDWLCLTDAGVPLVLTRYQSAGDHVELVDDRVDAVKSE
jgi:hypothetical protein